MTAIIHRMFRFFCAAGLTLGLAACDMSVPSQIETGHMRLSEETRSVALPAAKPDIATARRIAADFRDNGRGDMHLVMPYRSGDPLHETQARRLGKEWQSALAKGGAQGVKVEYVGMTDAALLERAVVSYTVLAALPPVGCGQRLTGYQGGDTLEDLHKYRIGCETRTAFSKMIVNPEDLKGRDGSEPGDSRRQGTVSERYMSGEGMERLETTSASGIGR
ncbi:MAG: CpaD family pilus assembly lipoprotein [Alphaproteobacteria bacterium]